MRAGRAIACAALMLAPLALGACAEGGLAGNLRQAGIAGKPDEFMVLPTRPLEMPQDLSALPPPTPGAPNRVAYQPRTDAIVGLTGRPPPAGNADGSALVARAGPRDPGIRAELAVEDVQWRETHNGLFFERLLSNDRDRVVYQEMLLNAPEAWERMRARGVEVPAAPPSALQQ
jgi:hypothetical protein